ncbi:MAG: response regulator [Magnetococcus sp. YQC-9]
MKRILVIDDDPQILNLLTEMLHTDSHEVKTVTNGRLALRLIREQGPWDVILCDILMPQQDGIETMLAIRKLGIGQKVVAMTGGGRYLDIDQIQTMIRDFGVPALLRKPFSLAQLLEAIDQVHAEPIP